MLDQEEAAALLMNKGTRLTQLSGVQDMEDEGTYDIDSLHKNLKEPHTKVSQKSDESITNAGKISAGVNKNFIINNGKAVMQRQKTQGAIENQAAKNGDSNKSKLDSQKDRAGSVESIGEAQQIKPRKAKKGESSINQQ